MPDYAQQVIAINKAGIGYESIALRCHCSTSHISHIATRGATPMNEHVATTIESLYAQCSGKYPMSLVDGKTINGWQVI